MKRPQPAAQTMRQVGQVLRDVAAAPWSRRSNAHSTHCAQARRAKRAFSVIRSSGDKGARVSADT